MRLRATIPRLPVPGGATLVLALALAGAVEVAHAQNCTILSSGDTHVTNAGTPQELVYMTVPVVSCAGGRRISASQAYVSEASGSIQLIGNVVFEDTARTMTAENAQYFSRLQRLSASGNVVMRHRGTNSTIRSQQLEYLEATPTRQSLMQAMGGEPRAVLRQAGQQDSTVLDAQQIDIVNDDMLRGIGDAVLTRDSMQATAYIIEYAQGTGVLELTGREARVVLPDYRLAGDSITATIAGDERIEEVLARHGASLESEEMDVRAGAIRLFFDDVGVSRMVASRWQPVPGQPQADQSVVTNPDFRMVADSLEVLAPQQQITEAVAVGGAFVERISPDSVRALLPETTEEVAALIANDWMRGDTIRAFFTAAPGGGDALLAAAVADSLPRAPADTLAAVAADTAGTRPAGVTAAAGGAGAAAEGAPERVMERLTAVGEPARTMHRAQSDEDDPDARLSIAYLIGRRVEITFVDGVVSVVTASEDVRGVYLQPADAARAVPEVAGTTARAGGRP